MEKSGNILVCVTRQRNCDRLIKYGASFQNEENTLYILHMVNKNEKFLHASDEGMALEYLFDIAKVNGAELSLLKTESLEKSLEQFIEEHNIQKVIFGKSNNGSEEKESHRFAKILTENKSIEILII